MSADPRYPLGPMPTPLELSTRERETALTHLRLLPGELRAAVAGLSNAQLDTPTARAAGPCGRWSTTSPRAT